MTDYADEAELHIEERDAGGRRVPNGCAPCGCLVLADDHLTQCARADAEGRPRPAGCTRRLTGMVR